MATRRMMLPDYGTVSMKGTQYYRTRVTDQQGRRVSLYARTREELYQKEQEAIQQIENKTYRRSTPTVEEYCEKWLLMQSAQIRMTTLIDYTSKVKNYIIKPLGDMHMGDVTADDIRLALLAASKKSASVYKGLRREEILGLQWDSVYLDCEAPYLTVRRAWHTEHNRPVILTELKTKAAHRNVPLPDNLLECLKEAKKTSTSDFVVANRDGDPLSYTQFKRLWQYIVTRTTKERCYYRYEDGKRVKHTVKPVLGQKAAHNGNVVYSLDFEVTPHQLRHTYITNLIHASVDPKTVQYLAGHESSKITMDIYAKVKYNRPEQLAGVLEDAFASWD